MNDAKEPISPNKENRRASLRESYISVAARPQTVLTLRTDCGTVHKIERKYTPFPVGCHLATAKWQQQQRYRFSIEQSPHPSSHSIVCVYGRLQQVCWITTLISLASKMKKKKKHLRFFNDTRVHKARTHAIRMSWNHTVWLAPCTLCRKTHRSYLSPCRMCLFAFVRMALRLESLFFRFNLRLFAVSIVSYPTFLRAIWSVHSGRMDITSPAPHSPAVSKFQQRFSRNGCLSVSKSVLVDVVFAYVSSFFSSRTATGWQKSVLVW